ncbi:Nif3-like dinuclear metal center hexameric protein [Rothia halotolerans]|uniref:Nif3-like dinuclear metal center hexameric protein n=1 Tax=Rothia halotolerans TaxID=405770 RepID=UPI00101C9E08|nr:Nif3-like dinuclear metal center hexameric protein [Rothia halotolerans]
MTHPTIDDVVRAAHELWPLGLQEPWDASGLICGRGSRPVPAILFAVDAVAATAEEAVERGAGLLLTHHPLLLRGAKFLPDSSDKGAVIHKLIENRVGLLAAHTNADSAVGGVSDALIRACGVEDAEPLVDAGEPTGIGRVGELPEPLPLEELARRLSDVLLPTAGGLRVAGPRDGVVRRVAVCGGAGDSLFDAVRESRADVYVTADLRHHPASEARERALLQGGRPYLIDCSHFASEQLWLEAAAAELRGVLAARGFEVETMLSRLNTDPWDFVVRPEAHPGSASTDALAAEYPGQRG